MYEKYEYSGAILLKNHTIHALDLLSLKKKTDPGGHTGGTVFKLEYLNKFEFIFETALGETYLIYKKIQRKIPLYTVPLKTVLSCKSRASHIDHPV